MTEVTFWGGSENFQFEDLSNIESFLVEIWSDGGGAPGTLVASELFGLGETNPVPTGGTLDFGGIEYEHTAVLTTPVELVAGQTYWLSVGAILEIEFLDAYFWDISSTGNRSLAADLCDGSGRRRFNNSGFDMAFALATVPAPAALPLFGAAAWIAVRRRR